MISILLVNSSTLFFILFNDTMVILLGLIYEKNINEYAINNTVSIYFMCNFF